MKKIEKLEQARNIDKCLKDQGINSTFFYAYEKTLETTNESINFSDVIWEADVKPIIEHCREFDIDYITITNCQSRIEDILALFVDNGCSIKLAKVTSKYIDFNTNKPEIKNAIKVVINK